MNAKIIDGKEISYIIKREVKADVLSLNEKGMHPTLAVVIVGENPASQVYVRNKKKACDETSIRSVSYEMPEETTENELLEVIERLNNDTSINGILVQLPLPKHINENKILLKVAPEKDVDCFHPYNIGLVQAGMGDFKPCTPAGVIELLKRSNIEISGKNCVVIGRSNIVGKPMALLLLEENGTVTIAHSKTKDLREVTSQADIVVVAIGIPKFLTSDMIKNGCVIIDVGINRFEGKLCGDADFEGCKTKAAYITPVPGGVGPMTIAMLMKNCLTACKNQNNK